jgi:pyruvate-formate lyase
MIFGPDPKNALQWTAVVMATSMMRHSQNWTPDFSEILTRGVKGIRQEAQSNLVTLSEPRDAVYKKAFLEAVVITCDAMTIWSRRYAQCARDLAAKERNPQRKKELEEIAEVCEWVPENPARTLREALQAQWWGQMFNRVEWTSSAMGQGRFDQYLWPYYQKDLADGRITKESTTELFHCLRFEHGAVCRDQAESGRGGRHRGILQVRGHLSRRPDTGGPRRDQRAFLPHPGIDPRPTD